LELSENDIDPPTLAKPRKGQHSQAPPIVNDVEDDEETHPTHTKKSRKRLKGKSTVVESSDDPNSELDQGENSGRDSDIEVIEDPKEKPEEELGKFFITVY
jgi:predicted alpha/beta hydrolase family esterase